MRLLFRLAQWLVTAGLVLGLVGVILFLTVPRLLGWELQVVLGRSMEPALPVGAVTFVQPTAADQVRVGDMLAYWLPTEPDKQITHRVEEVVREGGSLSFRTKGDANEDPDSTLVPAENVVGRVRWHIPWLGYLAHYLRTPVGFLTLLGIPGLFIITSEGANIFRQLRRGGQGGGSGSRSREPGEPRKSRRLLWLTVLGVMAFGAAVGALWRPAGPKARRKAQPPKTVTAAARWRWAWLGCLLVLLVTTTALWAGGSRAVFTDRETSYDNSMQVGTDLNPGPGCEEGVAEHDCDGGADETDEQNESPPDETEADEEGEPEPDDGGPGVPEEGPEEAVAPSASGLPPLAMPAMHYEVQPGDTLIDIAARFGTTVEALVQLNGLEDPNAILYGSKLNVPCSPDEPADTITGIAD